MQLKEIVSQVNGDVEEEYDAATIVGWVNRALDDLTPIAKMEAYISYSIDSANSYPLPADYHNDAMLLVNDYQWNERPLSDRKSTGYRKWAGKLSLQGSVPSSGTIDLYFYRRLKHLSTDKMEAEPEIEPEYHDLLIHYAAGMIQFTEEEYDRPDAMGKYNQRKEEYAAYKISQLPPSFIRMEYP
ncbi:phage adaptor protein [Paenibacillus spongiae]|uniref:Uncharacterized protein n=1 Tax=Paenibacillus spongiae TaxID=2909671 RepID=A0ABY5SC25_9BACL|nr:hypothetical protein [Paenibacillus spongiae]UVI31214.1 hypothetical protein L1F29_05050 [Paenibacillus spongiae]